MEGFIGFVIYTILALIAGYSVLSGRSYWLDRPAPLNMIVKVSLSIVVGYVIGMFYIIYLLFRLLRRFGAF